MTSTLTSPKSLGELAWNAINVIGASIDMKEEVADSRFSRFASEPCIYALWHGRIVLPILRMRNCGIIAMVSEHRDGEIVTRTLMSAGFDTVRGSSTRGGVRALARMVKLAREGNSFAFTADGPRGPRWHLQPGTVYLAAKTGLPVIPVTGSVKRSLTFTKSWDHFQLPLPFTRGIVSFGKPYYAEGGTEADNIEFHRAELERIMIDQTRDVDARLGVNTPE